MSGRRLITIAFADHHHLIRQSLRSLLEKEKDFKVVGEVADGLKVVRLVERRKPRVIGSTLSDSRLLAVF